MINLAIEILWFLVGVVILGGVVWIALYVLHSVFQQLPAQLDRVVWGVFGILCLIYALMILSGNAPSFRPRFGFTPSGAPTLADAAGRAGYLPQMWRVTHG
jgi:hypothetical protein